MRYLESMEGKGESTDEKKAELGEIEEKLWNMMSDMVSGKSPEGTPWYKRLYNRVYWWFDGLFYRPPDQNN